MCVCVCVQKCACAHVHVHRVVPKKIKIYEVLVLLHFFIGKGKVAAPLNWCALSAHVYMCLCMSHTHICCVCVCLTQISGQSGCVCVCLTTDFRTEWMCMCVSYHRFQDRVDVYVCVLSQISGQSGCVCVCISHRFQDRVDVCVCVLPQISGQSGCVCMCISHRFQDRVDVCVCVLHRFQDGVERQGLHLAAANICGEHVTDFQHFQDVIAVLSHTHPHT